MDFFKSFVYSFHDLSEASFKKTKKLFKPIQLPKGEQFVKVGQICSNFYLLKSGIIRAYIIDEKGKERTRTIYTQNSTTGNLGALITKTPSKLVYECLTDCELLQFNYNSFHKLSLANHEVSILHYKALEAIFLREISKILEIKALNATERYEKLRNRIPNIDNTINQYHIASYLNITPVQLSRIRNTK